MQTNYKEKILDKFCSDVFPAFMKFEEQRKKTLIKMILVEAILVLIPTLFFINIHVLENFNGEQLPIAICTIIFVDIIVALVYPNWVCSDFQNKLKEMAMPTVINAINGIKHMRYYCRFTKDELEKTGLFSRFSQMSSDDSFFGKYKNVKYQISELLLEVNGRKNTFTSFKGVVFAFDMNKNFESKVIITTKNDFNSKNNIPISMFLFIFIPLINFIFAILQGLSTSNVFSVVNTLFFISIVGIIICSLVFLFIAQSLLKRKDDNVSKNKITLEDIEFSKRFDVYSDDDVEARYLITTAFMERLLNLKTAFKGKNLKCAFVDKQIFFAISTNKNLFEFGSLFKSLNKFENIEFFNELLSIIDMIDYFKIDEKIGL